MKYVDEYRSKQAINNIAEKIRSLSLDAPIRIMEVCGTHTHNFFRFGLRKFIPKEINFISGPGCPVCVSTQEYIDKAISLSKEKDTIILSFGDMLRVPGTYETLESGRGKDASIKIVYSAWDSIKIAKDNPDKKIIFLGVGFETTAPTIALTILAAKKQKIKNLFFFCGLKLIPPAMEALLQDPLVKLDGFLCPGHVSAIIGARPYEKITRKYKISCCVTGFEPVDILEGILILARRIKANKPTVDNEYARTVRMNGNLRALNVLDKVFCSSDVAWRGLGVIPKSGLKLRSEYSSFDAERVFTSTCHKSHVTSHQKNCKCGDVLKGIIQPPACPLFGRACQPQKPIGPCMISQEGACNAYYKFK